MNSEEIKRLLEKYYEGNSTLEEELLLKKFFREENVPEDLGDEREIFMYYGQSSNIPVPSAGFEERIISVIDEVDAEIERIKRRRLYVTLSGIAAGLLILAGSYFFFTNRSEARDTYSDPELAYAETLKILHEVSSRLNQGTKALGHLSALQYETQKTMATVRRSAAKIEDNIKPLDNVFDAIGKTNSNYKINNN